MKKYLAIDSGGSKTAAVLYDENLNRLGATVAGSMRTNTTADDIYVRHMEEMVGALRLEGETIEQIGGVCESRVIEYLKSVCRVKDVRMTGEGDLGFFAAGVLGDGILALCGTGATVFARLGGKEMTLGGYGAAVSDEGSGYYIGRQAFMEAIRDYEGRGPRTSLTDVISKKMGFSSREQFRSAVFSIYGRTDRSPVATVASFVPDIVRTADEGDDVARGVLTEAGERMGDQVMAMIRMERLPADLPVALSGSVWRDNPFYYNAFLSRIGGRRPVEPRFEPVIGALIKTVFLNRGSFGAADLDALYEAYPEFRYDIRKTRKA